MVHFSGVRPEPSYGSFETCPIHQGLADLALLEYADWKYADPLYKEPIKAAIDRHWQWFNNWYWKLGNDWRKGPLDFPAWCAVTNQDLVVVAALARYGQVYGDFSRYNEYGKPVLDYLLSPAYYHKEIGIFERGDRWNFAERTIYHHWVLKAFGIIHLCTGDPRLPEVMDNVSRHLFDAVFVSELDGMTHLAWGANTDPNDKSRVTSWIYYPISWIECPELLLFMENYLLRHPDSELKDKLDRLEKTLAAYVFADGTTPRAFNEKNWLFAVVGASQNMWYYLTEKLGDRLQPPVIKPVPSIVRTCGDTRWKSDQDCWIIEKQGKRIAAGYKAEAMGVALGEENIEGVPISDFKKPQFREFIRFMINSPNQNRQK